MQGGGTGQFAAVPLNLAASSDVCDYAVTGSWSQKAFAEAKKYCQPRMVCNGQSNGKYTRIPDLSGWELHPEARYLYYCSNETVDGVQFQDLPTQFPNVNLIADMSSDFLSRPVDVAKHAIIYAGAQKNSGIAGLTIVIVRDDLLNQAQAITPTVMNYKIFADNKSLYHTPPTFSIYMAGLVFRWTLDQGGLEAIKKISEERSNRFYSIIDQSNGFYRGTVEKEFRSKMNITLRLKDEATEATFLAATREKGIVEIAGHRSVGGIRISLYNAVPEEGIRTLIDLMQHFPQK
eukprot:TRINITY_DN6833_c0_g1_i4.p1 TRINITY_DN6833_c0_g1~~TRINITY_DN6833_c0_g1_i4.p1  ORF type:complete len:291 (+),score=50.59 TRINITY_DN6833_c0_g1_i4:268-1140(+)